MTTDLETEKIKKGQTNFQTWTCRGIVLVSTIIVAILHVPLLVFPIGRDQGVWLLAARAMAQGKTFFKDFMHFNLPGTGFMYRAILPFVPDIRHVPVVVGAVGAVLIVIALYLLLKETVSPWAGAFGAFAFACLWPFRVGWWSVAQKDFLASPWFLLAAWCAACATLGRRSFRLWLLGAGLFISMATQFKPVYFLVGILLVVGFGIRRLRDGSLRGLPADVAVFCAGGLIGLIPLLFHLLAGGGFSEAWYSVTVLGPSYLSGGRMEFERLLRKFLADQVNGHTRSFNFAWLLMLTTHAGILLWLVSRQWKKRFWLLPPALVACAGLFLQGKGMGYHLVPWFVLRCAFMGVTLGWVMQKKNIAPPGWRTGVAAILAAGFFIGFFQSTHASLTTSKYVNREWRAYTGKISRELYYKRFYGRNKDFPNPQVSVDLADYLREHTTEYDTMVVWGHECQIYLLADRDYAGQTPYDQSITAISTKKRGAQWMAGQQKRYLRLLEKQKPKFFVVTHKDKNPVERLPSNRSLKLVPGLKSYLKKNYEFDRDIERFKIYRRKETVGS